jgi:large subunit ribosomal protein L24
MSTFNLKAGDEVIVIAGKDKGKKGKVLQAFPRLNRVVVEGVRVTKRHLRTRKQGEKGQIVEVSMPIHASNVQPLGGNGKAVRHTKAASK